MSDVGLSGVGRCPGFVVSDVGLSGVCRSTQLITSKVSKFVINNDKKVRHLG